MIPGLTTGMREYEIHFDRNTGQVMYRVYMADWINTLYEEMHEIN